MDIQNHVQECSEGNGEAIFKTQRGNADARHRDPDARALGVGVGEAGLPPTKDGPGALGTERGFLAAGTGSFLTVPEESWVP